MKNSPGGPRDKLTTLPDSPHSRAAAAVTVKPSLEVVNKHLVIQQRIFALQEEHPLLGVKLWTAISEILGRQFMTAEEVLKQYDLFGDKHDEALTFFAQRLEGERKRAMERWSAERRSKHPGAVQAVVSSSIRTLIGGSVASPNVMAADETKPKK